MSSNRTASLAASLLGLLLAAPVFAQDPDDSIRVDEYEAPPVPRYEFEQSFEADVTLEGRWFPQEARDPQQGDGGASLAIEPEHYAEWNRGDVSLLLTAFGRYDSMDDQRSHIDLREAYMQWAWRHAELRVGVSRVFWGKTEISHLVDVINQDDALENLDGEDKLGQPMLRLNLNIGAGVLQLYGLPLFRERAFAGPEGRLRAPLPVNDDEPLWEDPDEENHFDWAVRYQSYWGPLDYGIAHFSGTARDPQLVPQITAVDVLGQPTAFELRPFYPLMDQTSIDAQLTLGGWLLKLEALYRDTARIDTDEQAQRSLVEESYAAATGGFEYTFYGLFGSAVDFGLIVEYLWDERDELSPQPFQNDVFVGGRLAANDVRDTAVLGGVVVDAESDAMFVNLEASRRLSGSMKLAVEVRAFTNIPAEDSFSLLDRDDLLQIELSYFF